MNDDSYPRLEGQHRMDVDLEATFENCSEGCSGAVGRAPPSVRAVRCGPRRGPRAWAQRRSAAPAGMPEAAVTHGRHSWNRPGSAPCRAHFGQRQGHHCQRPCRHKIRSLPPSCRRLPSGSGCRYRRTRLLPVELSGIQQAGGRRRREAGEQSDARVLCRGVIVARILLFSAHAT